MKSDIEIEDIIYTVIKTFKIKGTELTLGDVVNGEIYSSEDRPTNSGKEDIVIKFLEGLNGLYQDVIVNVNIYTQNLNKGADTIINKERIRVLSRYAIDLLHGIDCKEYSIKVKKQQTFEVKETFEHATNIQLLLTYVNF